jgi:hypothetical protein
MSKDLEEGCRDIDLFEGTIQAATEENQQTFVRIASSPAGIRTGYLLNITPRRYIWAYTNPIGKFKY